MNYLLDTNVLCEATKPRPDAKLTRWLAAQASSSLFTSVVPLAEIRKGVFLLPEGKKRRSLEHWLESDLLPAFSGRILALGEEEMWHWAVLQAEGERLGHRISAMDSLIAATARCHGLAIATRNVADFKNCRVRTFNPWSDDEKTVVA